MLYFLYRFDGIKNITSGEGGCVMSSNKSIINKVKDYRQLGIENLKNFKNNLLIKKFNVSQQGWRYHMSDIMAAIGLSQYNRFKKIKFRKTEHVYFPIDENYLTNKFLEFWKPKVAIFIDSEIWPNMIENLKRKNIPIVLINGRITPKSYKRWLRFPNFAKKIFSSINLALPQNKESKI